MSFELVLTPSGRIRVLEASGDDAPGERDRDGWERKAAGAFAASPPAGLFCLAADRAPATLSSVVSFWRDFASRHLTELCRTPALEGVAPEPIGAPADAELTSLLLSAPPMPGGEYLNAAVLRSLWVALDEWVREEIAGSGADMPAWLERNAPLWRQVGRVCFHLAENTLDPDYPFGFLATYAPGLGAAGKVLYQPLGKALVEYAGERNRKALVALLSPVQRASERLDFVRELVESGDLYHALAWTPAEAYQLLQSVPALEESGLLVRLPEWWKRRPRARVAVTIGEKRASSFGVDAILDFQVGLALGDERLGEEEWQSILASEEGLVLVRGQWVEVDREKLAAALEHWKRVQAEVAEGGLTFVEGMRLLAGGPADLHGAGDGPGSAGGDGEIHEWSFIDAGAWLSGTLSGLRDPASLEIDVPAGAFHGTLRPYQETGRNWLWLLTRLGLGACLADDMGLGKTVQLLALLSALKAHDPGGKPSLLVLPASLIANWKEEIRRFAPDLSTVVVHPSETGREEISELAADPSARLAGVDLVLTTYGMVLRQPWLADLSWRLVVLDEAQAVKNPSARQTKAVKRLQADARIALTGTPLENRLSDLWSLFDFLCPGLLGSATRFKTFVKAMEERGSDRYAPLRRLVQPYILRRLKTDRSIIADLPDKIEMKAFCGLSKRQASLYTRSVEELARALGAVDGMKRRGLVLAYLLRLKQICNHPSHFLGDGAFAADESGKFGRLGELCEEIASRQEKALVFTQFREMTDPLAAYLAGVFGTQGVILHGGTAVAARKSLVDRFQRDDGPPFFVLSLKAGGTGLNLTAASHVVHFDRWWNPAVENQATDRAFRIGQHRNVTVHKFICRGTVEEKIDSLIEEKRGLASDILETGGETMLTELSNAELLDIVSLDVNRSSV